MKKIRLIVISKLYHPWIGGVETIAKQVAEGLKDKAEVSVIACQPKGKGTVEEIGGVTVRKCGSIGIYFSMPVSFSFPFVLKKYAKDADVVIINDPFPLGDLAVLLSGFKGKVILWWHSDIIKQKKLLKLINPIIHGILKRSDAIFTTTEGYIEGSSYISKYREKCRLVPFGLDIPAYLNAPEAPILSEKLSDEKSVKVLFVGRLVYYKGIGVLIEAFKKVSGAELFIIGTGSDEAAVKESAKELKNRVHFMCNLSDDDLKSAFRDCDLFVLPSIEKTEAFGIVQLEAMVYGKPVINTDLKTSVPFVSLDGKTGITVKAGDSEELAAAINKLVSDRELRERYGANAAERVRAEFDEKKMIENVYRQCKQITEK